MRLTISALVLAACAGRPGPQPNPADLICSADFKVVMGMFQANPPMRPADHQDGCWPIGMWSFKLMAKGQSTCPSQPPPLSSGYQMLVEGMVDAMDGAINQTFKYVKSDEDTTTANVLAKVTEGGPSCEGHLELFDKPGTEVWSMTPELDSTSPTSTISGTARYELYRSDQWAFDNM
jgi:hypothetical protein